MHKCLEKIKILLVLLAQWNEKEVEDRKEEEIERVRGRFSTLLYLEEPSPRIKYLASHPLPLQNKQIKISLSSQ